MAKSTKLTQRGIGDLQRSCERYETYNDGFILPDTLVVVRLDAHRYGDWSALTEDYPTGPATTKALLITARALMSATFRVVLAYVHGDEISLVIDPTETTNPLRRSKLISALSSAAAVHFLRASGLSALFNAKVSELPSVERLIEYLFWQRRYCYRNAITVALRKALHQAGYSPEQVEAKIHSATEEQRVALLAQYGTPVTSIPQTTRRGSLLSWETVQHESKNILKVGVDMRLSDNDEDYEGHIRALTSRALDIPVSKPIAMTTAQKQRSSPVVVKVPQPEKSPVKSPAPQTPKKAKKAHVSVFRMPPTQ